jgi:autotransporter translocation and assembly factor TamB
VRLHSIFRLREQARALAQKVRRALVFVLVLAGLATVVAAGKNALLNEVRKEIRKTYAYDRLALSYFPPALVVENVRSLGESPAFRVRKVRIEVSYLSLLRSRKAISVVLDSPEVRLAPPAPDAPRRAPRRRLSIIALPFIIERGVIENGTFAYAAGTATLEAGGIRGLVTQAGDAFTVRATAATSGYVAQGREPRALGALTVLLSGKGENVAIERLAVEGPDLTLAVEGDVLGLFDPAVELAARFDADVDFLDKSLHLPFDWRGRVSGEGRLERKDRRIAFTTSLASNTLILSGTPMGLLRGRFELLPGTGGRLEADLQKPDRPAERLVLTFRGGRVEGRADPLVVDPVFSELAIPWPVRSLAVGSFTVADRRLSVDAEFRDEDLERRGDSFAFRGGVAVGVDFPAHYVTIEAPGLETSFGRFEAKAAFNLKGEMDARIRGTVFDARSTREFVSLMLEQPFAFGQVRGRGYADVRLSGRSAKPTVAIKATLSPGGYERFDAANVEADVLISPEGFEGRFDVDDAGLKGLVNIRSRAETLEVDVEKGDFELAKVLPALEVPVSFMGRAVGDFRMIDRGGALEFGGAFSSPEVRGYGETATNVFGRLEWKEGRIAFPELSMSFHGGQVNGRFAAGIASGDFDFDLRGEELDFRSVVPAAAGSLSFSLLGRGVFGRDRLGGLFSIKGLVLSPLDPTEARGDLRLDISGGRVLLELNGQLVAGDNPFEASFTFPLSGEPFVGRFRGSLTSLDLVVPWDGAKGRADYTVDVAGAETGASVALAFDMAGPLLPLPGFAYALDDFKIAGKYFDERLTLSSIGGTLGGGTVTGSGEVGLSGGAIATMDLRLDGRDMVLSPMERVRAQADASLRLLKDRRRFVTEGEILFKRLNWRREIYEKFGFSSQTGEPAGPSFFDGMSLNVRLRADENFLIENGLGRFDGRFNLTVVGALAAPILLGDIDVLSGDFYFQDRSFRVIHGRLSFTDPASSEPYLDFRGETYVKDFRVTLDLSGPTSRLKPEFTSSPPLSPDEILSLLALGDAFRRMYYSYSGDRSTALSTASLLTYQIADLAKKRTGGVFSLDRLRIDPYIPEGSPGGIAARITVGKKISKNLLFLYSTIVANSTVMSEIEEVPIFRMEWDISRRFSLVGGRDDRGRLGFDVKFRKRF